MLREALIKKAAWSKNKLRGKYCEIGSYFQRIKHSSDDVVYDWWDDLVSDHRRYDCVL